MSIVKNDLADKSLNDPHRLLRNMIDQVPDYLFVKDLDCRFIVANEAVARIHGFESPDDLTGKNDFDLHDASSAARFSQIERQVIRTGVAMIGMEECVVDAASGKERWLSTSKVPLRSTNDTVVGLVGISRDISARKRDDFLRDEQTAILEMIVVNSPLHAVLDRLVRLMERQLVGVYGSILLLDDGGTHLKHGAAPTLSQEYCRAIDGLPIGPGAGSCGTAAWLGESVIVADIASNPLWKNYRDLASRHGLKSCWSAPVLSHDGIVLGTFALYSAGVRHPEPAEINLTQIATRIAAIAIERKHAEDKIRHMAYHDMLTGLPNRILLTDRLTQAMLQTKRHNPWVSVLFVDLDNFKFVNDSLGHTAGDELLKTVARRMENCIQPTDAAVRMGGDEFVILLTDLPENTDAIAAAMHKIRAAILEPMIIRGREFHITCSIGIATYPQDGTDAETLIANADIAMYKAKEAGRDGFRFFTPELNIKAHERLALHDGIRRGIAQSEFHLLYQPQVELEFGRIFAVEALVRWNHPQLGLINPNEFIPLAEETGLIVPLGEWVLYEACKQNKRWQDAGFEPITMCVNVSARQFHDQNWTSRVMHALGETELDAKCLELELTESLVMRDVNEVIATMEELRKVGVSFAIDDFGTGYSNLSALKSLPVSRLKIDRSFLRNLVEDDDDKTITAAVISLAQKLNMKVIAEGVETHEQLTFLRENHCDEVQGHLFSEAVSSTEIGKLLQNQQSKSGLAPA